jgi:hypothetical protein
MSNTPTIKLISFPLETSNEPLAAACFTVLLGSMFDLRANPTVAATPVGDYTVELSWGLSSVPSKLGIT